MMKPQKSLYVIVTHLKMKEKKIDKNKYVYLLIYVQIINDRWSDWIGRKSYAKTWNSIKLKHNYEYCMHKQKFAIQ